MNTRPAARVTRGIVQLLRHDMLFVLLNFEHGPVIFVYNYIFFIDGEQGFIQCSMAFIIFNESGENLGQDNHDQEWLGMPLIPDEL